MAHLRSWAVLTLHQFCENTGLKSMDFRDICPYSHGTSAHRLFILMIVRYPSPEQSNTVLTVLNRQIRDLNCVIKRRSHVGRDASAGELFRSNFFTHSSMEVAMINDDVRYMTRISNLGETFHISEVA